MRLLMIVSPTRQRGRVDGIGNAVVIDASDPVWVSSTAKEPRSRVGLTGKVKMAFEQYVFRLLLDRQPPVSPTRERGRSRRNSKCGSD